MSDDKKARGILGNATMFAAERVKQDDPAKYDRIVATADEILGKTPLGDIGFCGYVCGKEIRWKFPEE